MDWLLDPLSYEFMRQALIASLLAGVVCPIIGTYLIVQRMAMLGDVVAHGVLPGLAIAGFLNFPLALGAFSLGIFSTFVIAWIRTQSRIKVDTAMAITFSTFFSLGITLLSVFQNPMDLEQLLFGDILSVSNQDVWQIGAIAGLVVSGAFSTKSCCFIPSTPLGQRL